LLSKNIKIKINTTTVPVFCTGVRLGRSHSVMNVGCVFENGAMRGIFGPKRDEIKGELRKLHNEELINLYCSSNYSGDQKEKNEMGGRVARIVVRRGAYRALVGNQGERDYLEDQGVDWRVFRNRMG
jgi:hypothetical protein